MSDIHTFAIGQSASRVEDARMLRGLGRFTDDIKLARELHMVFVRSPHAHARIQKVELGPARCAPGVALVVSVADLNADRIGHVRPRVTHKGRDGKPMFVPPRPALADGHVRFVGDPVVAIIAESGGAARDAAELCAIDYEVLDASPDLEAATGGDAPAVWEQVTDNEAFHLAIGDGDKIDRAMASADRVVRARMRISRVSANAMEPRAVVAQWDESTRRFTAWIGTHLPHAARATLAGDVFGIDIGSIRVVAPDLGGSFGMREGAFPEYVVAMWAARRLNRPVRWVADRSEALAADYHGRDAIVSAELALDREGNFLALRVDTDANLGAYLSQTGTIVPVNSLGSLAGVYRIGAIQTRVTGRYTHSTPLAAYRGAGRPEATYVLERIIDIAATEMNMDPLHLRRRNLIPPEAMPYSTGFLYTYDSGEFAATLGKVLPLADWDGFAARRRESESRGRMRGIGFANSIEMSGGPQNRPFTEDADLRFGADGSATLVVGSKSHGQGHETVFTQMLTTRFLVPPEKVHVITGDTDMLPNGVGTFASRTMVAAGTAIARAGDRILEKAARIAGHMLEADPADIEFVNGALRVSGTDRSVSFAEICTLAHDHFRLPVDEDFGLHARASVSADDASFPNGSHVCEVEIDPETGRTELLGYWVVYDAGTVINPALADGQIHGGAAQGIGQAAMEEIRYDAAGQLLTGSFQDYVMPRADDFPYFVCGSHPVPTATNPLGVKGIGEAGTVGALPAYVNAVVNALLPFGVTHLDMPLTPEKIWRAISDGHGRQAR
jgi:aerobic carbon-monoxide dehydrogenase large subunit